MDVERVIKGLDALGAKVEQLLEHHQQLLTENKDLRRKRDEIRRQVEELIARVEGMMEPPARAPRGKKRERNRQKAATR